MRLQVYRYKCGSCGEWYEGLELGDFAYGEFLMRSSSGEIRFLEAINDPVFQEVSEILEKTPRLSACDESRRAEVLHAVFGVACDPDSKGILFHVGASPHCTSCGQLDVSEWEGTDPPRFVEVDVTNASHEHWATLSDIEKESLVQEALDAMPLV